MAPLVKHSGPLLGYNNNVPYRGETFHVQTEDSGSKRPHVFTHLFADGGRVIKTIKLSYQHYLGTEDLPDKVRLLMRDQHKSMVIALRDGELDPLIDGGRADIEERTAPELAPPSVEAPDSQPIELVGRATGSDEREFYRQMDELSREASPGAPGRPTPPPSEGPGSYSFVGMSSAPPTTRRGHNPSSPSVGTPTPPPRASTPPAADVVAPVPAELEPAVVVAPAPVKPSAVALEPAVAPAPSVAAQPQGQAGAAATAAPEGAAAQQWHGFGFRFVTERRFDEVVSAFLARRES